jgi:hypothetical protein
MMPRPTSESAGSGQEAERNQTRTGSMMRGLLLIRAHGRLGSRRSCGEFLSLIHVRKAFSGCPPPDGTLSG